MLHLVIDSCIFREDPKRKKVGFKSIEALGKKRKLKLHVPQFVYKEVQTNQIEEDVGSADKILKDLVKLSEKFDYQPIKEEIISTSQSFEMLRLRIESFVSNHLKQWIHEINGEIGEVASDHGAKVAQAYFSGSKPFKALKSRKDIPDAFIFQAVSDLIQNVDHLHFVSSDNGLRDACSDLEKITVYDSLAEFTKSEPCFSYLGPVK